MTPRNLELDSALIELCLRVAKAEIVEEERNFCSIFLSTSQPALDRGLFDGIVGSFRRKTMEIEEHEGITTFSIRVVPRASRDAVEGEYQGALKVRLTAPPVDDKANHALRRLLAGRLNVPVSAVRIIAGEKNRMKRVTVAGVTRVQIAALVGPESSRARDRRK
jgi:uncharacterized protein (TIGR00251 family)